jgi:hypothetical protein
VLRETVLVLYEIWHCFVGTIVLLLSNPIFENILCYF